MTAKTSTSSGGVGFIGLLTIAFIVLKLTRYIDWSWWWVLAPIWISILPVLLILLIVLVVVIIGRYQTKKKKNENN